MGIETEPYSPEEISAVRRAFFKAAGEILTKKVGYNVSDFDPGDLSLGDEACVTFYITVNGGTQSISPKIISGYTFTELSYDQVSGTRSFRACWAFQGTTPNDQISVDIVASDGSVSTLTGSDFFIGSGGGESLSQEFSLGEEIIAVKEFCFFGKPNVYQDALGQDVDTSNLIECGSSEEEASLKESIEECLLCALNGLLSMHGNETMPEPTNDLGNDSEVGQGVLISIEDNNACSGETTYGPPTNLVNLQIPDISVSAPEYKVTPSSEGDWCFEIDVICDGEVIGITKVGGTASAPTIFTKRNNVNFNHNNNGGTSNQGTANNGNCIANVQEIKFGEGVQWDGSTFEWVLSGVDTDSKIGAKEENDYVDFVFDSIADGKISNFYHGLEPQRNSTGAGDYNYCLELLTGNSSVVMSDNEYITEPQTGGDNGPNTRVNKFIELNQPIVAGSTYAVRMYLWNAGASGPQGSARLPNSNTPLPAGSVSVDDVSIGVECN